jgi:hypothetical protein
VLLLQGGVTAAIVRKPQNGGEDLTVLGHCAMPVAYVRLSQFSQISKSLTRFRLCQTHPEAGQQQSGNRQLQSETEVHGSWITSCVILLASLLFHIISVLPSLSQCETCRNVSPSDPLLGSALSGMEFPRAVILAFLRVYSRVA